MASTVKVAVLDDYQNFAEPLFKKLDQSKFEVTIFKDTLLPYNHPDTSQNDKDKLVKRLEPFAIICALRHLMPLSMRSIQTIDLA